LPRRSVANIGNNPGDKHDCAFEVDAGSYTSKSLRILAHPAPQIPRPPRPEEPTQISPWREPRFPVTVGSDDVDNYADGKRPAGAKGAKGD
jgi:hypothetical protein